MKTFSKILIATVFTVIVAAFVPAAKADEGDWATEVTIGQPVEIGNMVLMPGSYIFRLADIWAPNVVMIYSMDRGHWDGMVIGTPVYRNQTTEKSTFIFGKGAKGAPEALQYWYYPDSNYGIEFPGAPANIVAANGKAAHIAG